MGNQLGVPWLPSTDPFIHSSSPSLVNQRVAKLMSFEHQDWDVDILQDLFCQRDIDIIKNIPINVEEVDKWYWKADRHGQYTVKSAHSLLQNREIPFIYEEAMAYWKGLWKLSVPPKVKTFFLASLHQLSSH